MADPSSERVALLFLERFWSDRDAGRSVGLRGYLEQFPGQDEVVAREYLNALADARGQGEGEPATSEEGRIGPYRLLEELGRGGQGVVWLAEDTRLGRKVALKVLTGLGPGAEMHLARFRREAALASKLEHPGICGVHDTGIEGGVPYIAMRYVEGETLADRLSRIRSAGVESAASSVVTFEDTEPKKATSQSGSKSQVSSPDRKDLDVIVAAFEKVARALHAAHEVGIVHRDLKPGNIMITKESSEPVLLDFGLAQDDSNGSGPSLTQTGDLFGTPAYMSPEQITGRRVKIDRRSDVYSLGVTLYECLTMKRPFEAPTRESLYQAILSKEPDRARKLNRQIPPDLEVVVQCAMSKDRDKRYQTAADFAEDLRRVRAGEPILAKKVSMLGRAWRWSKRRPAAAALIAALALGIPAISGLGVWYWTHRDDVKAQERARREELLEDALEAGFFELHEGSLDQSVAAFEGALSLDAGSAEAVVGLALAHMRRDADAALRVILDGERTVGDPKTLARTKADILTRLNRKAEAAVALESAPKIEGPLMWFLEGTRAIDVGHGIGEKKSRAQPSFREAAEHLTRAVSGSPRARRAYHFQLAHAIGHCRPPLRESALAIADAIEGLWPTSPRAWRWIGFVVEDCEAGRALAAYREAIRLDDKHVDVHDRLGAVLAKQGKQEQAIAVYREAIRLNGRAASPHRNIGLALATQGRLEEAIAEYREAIRLSGAYAAAHTNLGITLSNQGNQEEAIAEFREAIRLDPEDIEPRINLARALAIQHKLQESIAEYREAIRLDAESGVAYAWLGSDLAAHGKWDEAIPELREAIRLDPKDARSRVFLGRALTLQDKLEEAIAEQREATRLLPENAFAHYSLGLSLARQLKFEEAIAECHEACRLDPKDASPHCTIGIILAAQGRHEQSIAEFREAIRIKPDDVEAHRVLAASLHAHGEPAEAVALQEKLVRLMNGKDVGAVKVVEVQDDLERYRDALEEAAQSEPSQPESRK